MTDTASEPLARPYMTSFSSDKPSLKELEAYLALPDFARAQVRVPGSAPVESETETETETETNPNANEWPLTTSTGAKRPYTWYNAVTTLDGVTSFDDPPDPLGAAAVALAHDPQAASSADGRVLFAGRMVCHALVHGGNTVRSEPRLFGGIPLADLAAERQRLAGDAAADVPLQVILSGSGALPVDDPECWLLAPGGSHKVVILTSPTGHAALVDSWGGVECVPDHVTLAAFAPAGDPTSRACDVDLADAFAYLYTKHGVRLLDMCAGGRAAAAMLRLGLIDEVRLTYTSQFSGRSSTMGRPRPLVFDASAGAPLGVFSAVRLQNEGLRAAGRRHLFLRASVVM